MDITKINRKIFDELSEAEKSRIIRFLSEDDTFKLSSTIARYVENDPNFVKSFFSELLRTKNNGALYILFCIPYNFFDEITKLLGQGVIYDLLGISTFDYREEASILVKTFINNYDKFTEDLKEKLVKEICNIERTLYHLTYELTWNLRDANSIYYKFSPEIREFVLLKSVKKSSLLLNSLYKELNEEIKEKALNILIQNNKVGLTADYLIEFISSNYSVLPEDKKQFFLNKLYEVANNESLRRYGNDVFYEFDNLYKNIPYTNFIELLEIFINKKEILSIDQSFDFKAFIDKTPEVTRNQILISQVADSAKIFEYENKYGSYPFYEGAGRLATLFSALSEKNFHESIKYLLSKKVGINFLINTLSENFLRFNPEDRVELLEQGLHNEKARSSIFYALLKNLPILPELADFLIKYIAAGEKILKWYRNDFITNFNNYNDEVKKKLLENPETKKLAYIALSRNINLLSEEGLNTFIRRLQSQNVPGYLISSFASNYKSFSEEVRLEILQTLIQINSAKRHIARTIFENFNLFNKENLDNLIKELINSEDKKVNYYLSKILNDFYERISLESREQILNKVIKYPENIDIFFSLIEEKIFKSPGEIIDTLSKSKLSRNVVKKLSKKFFQEINSLPEKILNYLILLSTEYRTSRYIAWDFIHSFDIIAEEVRTQLLNNFIIAKNPDTIETFLMALIDSESQMYSKEQIIFRITENPNYLIPFAKVLNKKFEKLGEDIRINLLRKVFIHTEASVLLLELLIENTTIPINLKKELLTNSSEVLESFSITEPINNKIETTAKKIKTKFRNVPDEIKNDVAKILFKNYSSRRIATLIIIDNSNKLSDEINSLLLIPLKENNVMIQEIEKIPQNIKEKILKNILVNDKNILIIKGLERTISDEWIKQWIINIEKKYKKPFQKISLEVLFKIIVQNFSSRDSINLKDFKDTLNYYSSTTGIEWTFRFDTSQKFSYNTKSLNTLFLSAIFSRNYQIVIINELQAENSFEDSFISLPFKILSNQKSINVVASKLRWDFYKFAEDVRNDLLVMLTDYPYTNYFDSFVVDAIKYNIDKIPKKISLQVIKKLNASNDWRMRIAEELKRLLY